MVDIFYSRVIWLKVGLISSEEKTSLSGFCIYQAGSRISKQCPNLGTVLPRPGSVGNSNRIPIRFPSDQQQDDRRHDESNNDQTPFSRPSIAFPALPMSACGPHLRPDPAGCTGSYPCTRPANTSNTP